ncbi:MAG: ribosome maturation factor RimM [Actinomycetota bacterium]|nr:ribosome maturation factor RimM [Actinomycetota bacterium]
MDVVVGVVGRPHALRGEVGVELRTDEPETRFAVGAVLRVRPRGPRATTTRRLTIRSARRHGARLLVGFDEVTDRTAAEGLIGARLVVDVGVGERPSDPEEFYDHQLVGLAARTSDGAEVGTVAEVRHLPAQDLLVIAGDGGTHLVPFVTALVPTVDLGAGTLTVDPVPGLLDADVVAPDRG